MNPDAWREHAACKGHTSLFYAKKEDAHGTTYTQARQLCNLCPVRPNCLEYALENWEDRGLWGGLTPRERQKARRTYRQKADR